MDYFSCAFNAFVLPHPRLHVLSEADECRAYRRGLSEPGVSVENHLISTSEPSCNASLKYQPYEIMALDIREELYYYIRFNMGGTTC